MSFQAKQAGSMRQRIYRCIACVDSNGVDQIVACYRDTSENHDGGKRTNEGVHPSIFKIVCGVEVEALSYAPLVFSPPGTGITLRPKDTHCVLL